MLLTNDAAALYSDAGRNLTGCATAGDASPERGFLAPFELEFNADASGDQPVLRWLREELSPTQRRAIGVAMAEILQEEGNGVCRGAYGRQLGEGLFEFRLRHDAAEILRSLGKPAR